MKDDYIKFIRSHNLINRIYDMVLYFENVDGKYKEKVLKKFFQQRLEDITYVESLAKYFDKKLNKNKEKIDLRYNLQDLIYDLEYLKQYLSK